VCVLHIAFPKHSDHICKYSHILSGLESHAWCIHIFWNFTRSYILTCRSVCVCVCLIQHFREHSDYICKYLHIPARLEFYIWYIHVFWNSTRWDILTCRGVCVCVRHSTFEIVLITFEKLHAHVHIDTNVHVNIHMNSTYSFILTMCMCILKYIDWSFGSHLQGEVGGWGRVPFSRNFMKPTPRRKWYLTTGRRAH